MASSGRHDPYSSRGGRADRRRRQVRTQGGRTRRPPKPRKRSGRRRRRGGATGVFGAVAAITVTVISIANGGLSIVSAVVGFVATSAVGYLEYRADLNEVHRQQKFDQQTGAEPPKTRKRAPSGGSGGGGQGGKRRRACDARCQNSVKPVETCKCSCGGSTHGTKAPGGQRSRSSKKKVP